MAAGRQSHDYVKCSYDDNKRVLPLKTLIAETWRYSNRSLWPLRFPVHYTILYMVSNYYPRNTTRLNIITLLQIQSGEYVLSADFVSTFKKVDFVEADILWRLIHEPASATIDDIIRLIFNSGSSPCASKRYYVHAAMSTNTPLESAQDPDQRGRSAYDKIREVLQRRPQSSVRTRDPQDIDVTETLPSDDEVAEVLYNVDRTPGQNSMVACPPTVEEATYLVNQARRANPTAAALRLRPYASTDVPPVTPIAAPANPLETPVDAFEAYAQRIINRTATVPEPSSTIE